MEKLIERLQEIRAEISKSADQGSIEFLCKRAIAIFGKLFGTPNHYTNELKRLLRAC